MSITGEYGVVRCGKCNTIRNEMVLDTQEQRKEKGAVKCTHCGVYCATDKDGED